MTANPNVLRGERTHLSPREIEILTLLAGGKRQFEIAGELFISPRTVEAHLLSAKIVFGARTTCHLVALFAVKEAE